MALDFGVVYEGFQTGVSQGTFTITQPGQLNHNWIAEGSWLPVGVKPQSENTRKYAPPVIEEESKDDRPVLHRRAEGAADKTADKDKDKDKDKNEAKPATGSGADSSASPAPASAPTTAPTQPGSPTQSGSSPSAPAGSMAPGESKDTSKETTKAPTPAASKGSDLDEPISDPNRPRLRRGKPDPNAHHEPFVDFDALDSTAKSATGVAAAQAPAATVQTIPAISDAGGPDARPYTYDLKPAEEAIYRNKMLDLAATLVKVGLRPGTPGQASAAAPRAAPSAHGKPASASATKPARPQFEDVNLRIFDLSNSNEPVLVFSARTPLPPAGSSGAPEPQEITLIARTDLEGEVQKLFFAQTDSRHLDVSPRMELIDAVDADGDGRGELLFRRTGDGGSAYGIYRVTADGLWPLYEGTP